MLKQVNISYYLNPIDSITTTKTIQIAFAIASIAPIAHCFKPLLPKTFSFILQSRQSFLLMAIQLLLLIHQALPRSMVSLAWVSFASLPFTPMILPSCSMSPIGAWPCNPLVPAAWLGFTTA